MLRSTLGSTISIALALLLLGGCATELTEIVVVVESDLTVPAQLDEIVVTAEGPEGIPKVSRASLVGADAASFPVTVGLRPAAGGAIGVTIKASGRRAGSDQVEAQVRTNFIEGRRLLVRIVLLASCVGVVCRETETCRAGSCVDAMVDPMTLPPFVGPIRADLGPSDTGARDMSRPDDFGNVDLGADPLDSGIDLGVVAPDGGSVDLGTDLGPPIACTATADCDDDIPCTTDICGVGGTCVRVLDDAMCNDGSVCTIDSCSATGCIFAAIACDDGDPCTLSSCRPATGCTHVRLICTGTPCIPSACNPLTGVCEGVPQPAGMQCFPTESGANCGGACTTAGFCEGTFGCSGTCECVAGSMGGSRCQPSSMFPMSFCAIK